MKSTLLLASIGSLGFLGVNALTLVKRENPAVLSLPFQRVPGTNLLHRKRSGEVLATIEPLTTLVTLSLGTPPQSMRVQLDTGSSFLIVETDSSNICTTRPEVCSNHGAYDANSSSTYEYLDSNYATAYGGGDGATGDDALDILQIGGATISKYKFGIQYLSNIDIGILGVGIIADYSQDTVAPASEGHFPTALAANGITASRAYSLWLNDRITKTGQVLFGGVDTEKFKGNLVAVSLVPDVAGGPVNFFAIPLLSVTVTDVSGTIVPLAGGTALGPALLDSGTNTIILPMQLAQSIFTALGAVLEPNGGYYAPCSIASGPTTLNVGFQGITINVPVQQILNGDDGTGACQVTISPSSGSTVILGDQILSSMYIVYDMDNSRVLLAETIFDATASNILQIMAGPDGVPNAPGVGGTLVSSPASTSSSSTSSTFLTTSTKPTLAAKKCNTNNCFNAFKNRAAIAADFCATYTAGGSQATPTYASVCSSAARVSSACSCIATATLGPATSAATTSSSATSTTLAVVTPTKPLICKMDNCLRAIEHSSAGPFCTSFLLGQPAPTPNNVAKGCATLPSRISSGCACYTAAA